MTQTKQTPERNFTQCRHQKSTATNQTLTSSTFPCRGGCKKQFSQEHHLLRHMKANKTKCKICRKVFCNNSMRIEHEKSHETKQSKNCLVCALGFLTLQAKALHLETHREQKPFTCKICKREFNKKFPTLSSPAHSPCALEKVEPPLNLSTAGLATFFHRLPKFTSKSHLHLSLDSP